MKKFLMIISLITVFTLLTSSTYKVNDSPIYSEEFREGITDFLLKSSKAVLSENSDSNIIYSPLGLYFVLAMIASASDGATLEEITTSIGMDIDTIEDETIKLMNIYRRKDGKTTFNIENAVYYDETDGDVYNESALDNLKSIYDASYERVSFKNKEVNSKIVNLIKRVTEGFLNPSSEEFDFLKDMNIAFLNVLYYNSIWVEPFDKKDTKTESFYLSDGAEKKVPMMNKQQSRPYKITEQYSSSNLDYYGGANFVMILPEEGVSVNDILSDEDLLKEALDPWNIDGYAKVNYKVPKFDYEFDIDLTDYVKALGMESVFDVHYGPNGDFRKLMNNDDNVFQLSGIRQSSRIQLDEEGVKVASSTIGFGCGGMSAAPLEELDFFLTRPFIYAITTTDGIPLFVGVVANP